MEKFSVQYVSGIAMGVGISKKVEGGTFTEMICETLYITGDDKKDAENSEKWAKRICEALNKK